MGDQLHRNTQLAVAVAVARGEVLFDAESCGEIAEANAGHAHRIRATLLVHYIMEKASDADASAAEILEHGVASMREALVFWLGEHEPRRPAR